VSVLPIVGDHNLGAACAPDGVEAGNPTAGRFCEEGTALRQTEKLLAIDHQGMSPPNPSKDARQVLVITEKRKAAILRPGTGAFLDQPEKIRRIQAEFLERDIRADEITHATRPNDEREGMELTVYFGQARAYDSRHRPKRAIELF
jgi:hypothetical protein